MSSRIAVGGVVAMMLGLAAAPARAQTTVSGGVVVQSGPVAGHVEVNSPPPVVVRSEPVREVIVVERTHVPRGNAHGWWKKHGYREVTAYYDGTRYYGRRIQRPGLHAVVVYEREGRYYLGEEETEESGHHHGNKRD
jgi:hypothetical protein